MQERIMLKHHLLALLLLCTATAYAQTDDYKMSGPYTVIARDGQYRNTKGGSERDMKAALDFATAGKTDEALHIINAYAKTLTAIDGHDAPLCTIQGFDLVRAMTLLKVHKTDDWERMVRHVWLPVLNKFEADSPYANGNWGAIVNRMRMACAIFLEDSTLYRASVDYYLHAFDNGSLPRYISETGQCQETGRDQSHAQLGLEALAQTAEMAWQQGDDLWGALDNRLMKGIEYTARYNLGYNVPFAQWKDCTGLYCEWTEPGQMGRGNLWDIYRLPYDHYVGRCGLSMPYTKMVLDGKKPKVKEFQKLHQVFTYPAPEGAPLKHDYDVYVQPRGSKEWTKVDTYMAMVNAPCADGDKTGHRRSQISYAMFDFTGDVFVRVVTKGRKYTTARIRPDYKGVIANQVNDSTLQFLLFQPENVSVEFDGSITDNLLLFTSKPPITLAEAKKQAKAERRKFVAYAPGLYTQDTIRVASNTTVYLAPGSYFTGTFMMDRVESASILGRGIARTDKGYGGCLIYRSKNIVVDGMTVCQCPVGESDGVTIHDVRSISHPQWGDGLNVFASQNVTFDRVFCRNSDDCTTAYATRKGFNGNARNVTMRNSTLWADVAHPIFIGLHGNSERGDTIENLRYENIDILCQSEPQVDYQGCLAINCGDNNLVRNVTFDNIRIEQIDRGSIVQVKVSHNQKYCTAPGRGVENITFRNIRYYGKPAPAMSVINGYSDDRQVKNITFEGLKINGKLIYDDMPDKPRWYQTSDVVPMYIGNHVKGVRFISTVQDGQFN